jgi:formylglycine-generating enzyme required for sulfatase activity
VSLTDDVLRRIARVTHARHLGFVELVGLAELDPATAFRGAVLRGDLSGQDLGGFDFTGATFADCDLTGADLARTLGVTPEMLANAVTDAATRPPRAFFWDGGRAPSWAEDWGRDGYGAWVSFRVPGTEVTQRMRWCPPGTFMMGSPDDEPDRSTNEGPRHKVTFAQGFWMFDTACTEQLWTAVTGAPPPGITRSARFPVTRVSWHDAVNFTRRLNTRLPGLSIGLPSEARWEYACRAGTQTPHSFGEQVTQQLVCFASEAPVAAASLPANPWGLYEMHGNVWEWCEDHWHGTYDRAPGDGSAWLLPCAEAAAYRVIRGGSWNGDAQDVRSAFRAYDDPASRFADLGFRCARVQTASGAERVAAPADPARRTGAERVRPQGTPGAATARSGLATGGGTTPDWATSSGEDDFGRFADITVPGTDVTQRLRWIPLGRFCMGSPATEPGRTKHEGPLDEVALDRGFWLFDTPCTQALWEAVMANNPSRFRSPTRPVESVSFNDATAFVGALNGCIPGLGLSLPSEAQWEYACRAGTTTATYAGALEIVGANNAPVLDAIAWYGGNSGEGFDLESGHDSSDWPDKQYGHTKAGTRPVGLKQPNQWGLHDMLGNVREWCLDLWHDTYDGAPADGSVWLEGGKVFACRVMRGGSWNDNARNVRAAYRNHNDPANRNDNVGFRCARAHERVGGSAPEQVCLHGVAGHRRRSPKPAAAGVLVGSPEGFAKARRPVAQWDDQ